MEPCTHRSRRPCTSACEKRDLQRIGVLVRWVPVVFHVKLVLGMALEVHDRMLSRETAAQRPSARGPILRGEHERALGPGIPEGANDSRLAEPRRPEFVEESSALPGSGDSRKPVGAPDWLGLVGQRPA